MKKAILIFLFITLSLWATPPEKDSTEPNTCAQSLVDDITYFYWDDDGEVVLLKIAGRTGEKKSALERVRQFFRWRQ